MRAEPSRGGQRQAHPAFARARSGSHSPIKTPRPSDSQSSVRRESATTRCAAPRRAALPDRQTGRQRCVQRFRPSRLLGTRAMGPDAWPCPAISLLRRSLLLLSPLPISPARPRTAADTAVSSLCIAFPAPALPSLPYITVSRTLNRLRPPLLRAPCCCLPSHSPPPRHVVISAVVFALSLSPYRT